jgi:hypothetical protein
MGNNKNTILVIVIAALFVASGVVLYKGIFANSAAVVQNVSDIASAQKEIVNLLPYGTSLDFTKVKTRATSSTGITYEQVDQNNVGLDVHNLISAATDTTALPTQVNVPAKRSQHPQ